MSGSMFARSAALIASMMICVPVVAETYVVPIWATALAGGDGTWWTEATAINANDFPVEFSITRVFPLRTAECTSCDGVAAPVVVPAHASVTVHPPSGLSGRRLVAGAFELDASGPLVVHLVAYRPGAREIRQRLDVATKWLDAGTRTISAVERGGADWRMNVFLVNPTDAALDAEIWSNDVADAIRVTVGPRETGVFALPRPRCGDAECPFPTEFPPSPITVNVRAGAPFLASVSSLETDWAVFAIADEARE